MAIQCEIKHNDWPEPRQSMRNQPKKGIFRRKSDSVKQYKRHFGRAKRFPPALRRLSMKRGDPLPYWASVHHTAYILLTPWRKVKHKCTKLSFLCRQFRSVEQNPPFPPRKDLFPSLTTPALHAKIAPQETLNTPNSRFSKCICGCGGIGRLIGFRCCHLSEGFPVSLDFPRMIL